MAIAEKGLDVKRVEINLAEGEQLGEAFRKINPSCTVPVLQLEDGTTFTENAGIAAYLEAIAPEPPLLGATPEEKGLVASYNAWIEFDGLWAIAEVLRNSSPRMANRALTGPDNYDQIPALAERGLQRLQRFLERFNAHIEGRQFVVGDRFSIADITAFIAVEFVKWVKVDPDAGRPAIAKWRASVAERPSAQL